MDTGKKDKDRFMLFTRESHLDVLENAATVAADGTFKVKKKFFRQIFTIHGEVNGKLVPLVFVLMKSKTKKAYRKVFKFIKSKRVSRFLLKLKAFESISTANGSSTLISGENCRVFLGEKLVKMLWFWTF